MPASVRSRACTADAAGAPPATSAVTARRRFEYNGGVFQVEQVTPFLIQRSRQALVRPPRAFAVLHHRRVEPIPQFFRSTVSRPKPQEIGMLAKILRDRQIVFMLMILLCSACLFFISLLARTDEDEANEPKCDITVPVSQSEKDRIVRHQSTVRHQ